KYTDVIERLKPNALDSGNIVHLDGRVLGRHDGIVHYTVGQRRGIKIPAAEPLYVVRLDASRNEVIVGPRSELTTSGLRLRNVNWLGEKPLEDLAAAGLPLYVRMRSSQKLRPALLQIEHDGVVKVELHDGEEGIATGQACVFYADDGAEGRILGGGWIAKTIKANSAERRVTDTSVAVAGR
ncbi:MAG: tRNA methyl transferase PRC-barrel domain-containing protein, partial [Hyphomicrobium sp.]